MFYRSWNSRAVTNSLSTDLKENWGLPADTRVSHWSSQYCVLRPVLCWNVRLPFSLRKVNLTYSKHYFCRKHALNCHRMKPALFSVLCEIKEKTGTVWQMHLTPVATEIVRDVSRLVSGVRTERVREQAPAHADRVRAVRSLIATWVGICCSRLFIFLDLVEAM